MSETAGFRRSSAVCTSLVAGEPFPARHGDGHDQGVRLGKPAPDDHPRGTEDGKTETWLVGGPAINRMEANGWTKTTVKPGDVITGTGYQFADGQKIIRLERAVMPDGTELRLYGR